MKNLSHLKEFLRCCMLSVLGTLGVSCYILADTFFVSKGLGINGLAALNLAIPVYNFIHGTGLMLGMGGATRFSVLQARGDLRGSALTFSGSFQLAGLSSLAFFLVGLLLPEKLALLLGAERDILNMTATYLKWLLLFSPAFIADDLLLCFLRNDDGEKLSMAAMLIGSFANILLDYIFIFPLNMGIFGAVFATGLSPVISILIMLPHWRKGRSRLHLSAARPSSVSTGHILALGFPSFIAQVSTGLVMVIFNFIILDLEGNTGVAAYGVVANISLVVLAVYTGIAQGVQPLISRAHGLADSELSVLMLRYAMFVMLFFSLPVYAFLFIYASPIAAIFNSEGDPALLAMAADGLRLYFTCMVPAGCNTILATFFTSVERAMPAHILSLLRGFALIVPMAFLLSALWDLTGVWLAFPLTELLSMLIGYWTYLRYKKAVLNSALVP